MTEGEAPQLLTAMLSKAGPTGVLKFKTSIYLENVLVVIQRCSKSQQRNSLFSTPFDAIADFARRTTGGGGGGRSRRDDSRERDLRFVLFALLPSEHAFAIVPNRIIGNFFE